MLYIPLQLRKKDAIQVKMSFILYLILAWVLYQVIFKFIIPVYLTARRVRKGFREMQEKMHQHAHPGQQERNTAEPKSAQKPVGDYIDFEEVK
jgi:hypothetical protein